MVIELMSSDNLHEILEFEKSNQDFFEFVLPPRPEGYYDKVQFEKYMSELLLEQENSEGYFHIIRDDSGEMVGRINVHTIKENAAELGYRIGRDFQGMGYATKAVGRIIDLCKKTYHLQSLRAGTSTQNMGSQRVLEKNGFVKAGEEKRVMKIKGEWIDGILYNRTIK